MRGLDGFDLRGEVCDLRVELFLVLHLLGGLALLVQKHVRVLLVHRGQRTVQLGAGRNQSRVARLQRLGRVERTREGQRGRAAAAGASSEHGRVRDVSCMHAQFASASYRT